MSFNLSSEILSPILSRPRNLKELEDVVVRVLPLFHPNGHELLVAGPPCRLLVVVVFGVQSIPRPLSVSQTSHRIPVFVLSN